MRFQVMQDFEKWLNTNEETLDTVAFQLFTDSLRCFKADIDRPAYLLAYQGMMRQLKMVILRGKRPDGFPEQQWIDYLKGLNHDHSWDENTYDRIVQKAIDNKQDPSKNRPAVLCMTDEVRNKFPFWREMRNVCAHYKEYNFIKAHTVVLYSFIEQYLLMITVEGGMVSLLNEFKKHYDPSLTPEGTDSQPLIDKIPLMIKLEEFDTFINALRGHAGRWDHSKTNFLLHRIYQTQPEPYKTKALEYIHNNRSIENSHIDEYPESILLLLTEKSEIREFWYSRVFYARKPLDIIAQLIVSGRLAGDEIKEAFDRLLSYCYANDKSFYGINKEVLDIVKSAGLIEVFNSHYFNPAFTRAHYKDICYKTDFFMSLLDYEDIDESFIDRTIEVFDSTYAFPYTLRDRFKSEFLKEDSDTAIAYGKALGNSGKPMPTALQ